MSHPDSLSRKFRKVTSAMVLATAIVVGIFSVLALWRTDDTPAFTVAPEESTVTGIVWKKGGYVIVTKKIPNDSTRGQE